MDLIIKKTKFSKNFFVNDLNNTHNNSTSEDVCYIKINMTLNKKLIDSQQSNNFNFRRDLLNPNDKNIKIDFDKLNLLQRFESNKTQTLDKEVLLNNNLKNFLNNHIKSINKTNNVKINGFIIKKGPAINDNSSGGNSSSIDTYSTNTKSHKNLTQFNKNILESNKTKKAFKNISQTHAQDKNITVKSHFIGNFTIMKEIINSTQLKNFNFTIKNKNVEKSKLTHIENFTLFKNESNHTNIQKHNEKIISTKNEEKSQFIHGENHTFIIRNSNETKIKNNSITVSTEQNNNLIKESKNSTFNNINITNIQRNKKNKSNFTNVNSLSTKTFNNLILLNNNTKSIIDIKQNKSEFVSYSNNITNKNSSNFTNHSENITNNNSYNSSSHSENITNNNSFNSSSHLQNIKNNNSTNSTGDDDYSIVIYKITYPDEEDLNTLSYILSLQTQDPNYQKICYQCLDNLVFLKKLNLEIHKVKYEMFTFSNDLVFTRQELIIRFSDYINRVNLVKIQLFEMKTNLDLLKAANCSNYDDNVKYYDGIVKKANQLIEIIQDTIRKQNLNINFIVIT